MISVVANTILSLGALFVTKDKEKGNIVINAAPFIGVGIASVSIGCSFSDGEVFSQCLQVSIRSLMEAFNL